MPRTPTAIRSQPSGRQFARRGKQRPDRCRTTLTLPGPLLREAQRIANDRHQTVSAVVATLMEEGLQSPDRAAQREARIIERWQRAFVPLKPEELLLLEGIVLEEPESPAR